MKMTYKTFGSFLYCDFWGAWGRFCGCAVSKYMLQEGCLKSWKGLFLLDLGHLFSRRYFPIHRLDICSSVGKSLVCILETHVCFILSKQICKFASETDCHKSLPLCRWMEYFNIQSLSTRSAEIFRILRSFCRQRFNSVVFNALLLASPLCLPLLSISIFFLRETRCQVARKVFPSWLPRCISPS